MNIISRWLHKRRVRRYLWGGYIRMELTAGCSIMEAAKHAERLARSTDTSVEFIHNGTHVLLMPGENWREAVDRWNDGRIARDRYELLNKADKVRESK